MSITSINIYNMYYKKVKLFSYLLSLTFLLSACSTTSESFDSESVPGVGAKSISKVNTMIDKGQLKGEDSNSNLPVIAPVVGNLKGDIPGGVIPKQHLQKIVLSDDSVVYRQNEEVARIWIAPFQDKSGNFYEGMVVHTLLQNSHWQIQNNPLFS
jgi:hypothetical protein